MTRQFIVAGNWKMNKTLQEGIELAEAIAQGNRPDDVLLILATPAIHLAEVAAICEEYVNLEVAAQNCHQEASGAFTGEISTAMIKSVGASYVILGHSERREYFSETDSLLAKKVDAVLAQGLLPIYCCGENLEIREAGDHVELVTDQVKQALFHLSAEAIQKVIIAYEPVWAIGTGLTASPEQAQEMHAQIRAALATQYGAEVANSISILYGGSAKPSNAKELFSQPDVDGGLIGGASLSVDDFLAIANSK